ncbi:MAG: hypothetical protein EU550_03785 [Promethearchaeota archaeon]|nr:MAG: hypothetical protein EU550_03785 [Candidatus Lokiarchaeota archaeon]
MPKKKTKKDPNIVKCRTCGGTGKVKKHYADTIIWVSGKMDGMGNAYEPCPTCGGTGWSEKK